MNILLCDVEMSLQVGYFYDQWKTNIPHHKIKHRGFMISAAWQWYGQKKIHAVSVLDDPKRFKKDFRDDYHVIKALKEELDKADAVVAFNGDRFDIKEINTGLVKHGLGPIHNLVQIDPCKIARQRFRFKGGNSLRNLCEFFKVKTPKGDIDDKTWIEAAEGCPKAIKRVVKYNKTDIPSMLEVWEKIRPYAPARLNANLFISEDVCPSCGHPDLEQRGYRYTRAGAYHRLRCRTETGGCGHWSQKKKNLTSVNVR